MANEFSIEIHNYLSKKISEAEKAIASDDLHTAFYLGQLEELQWMRSYLKEHVDLKDFIYY